MVRKPANKLKDKGIKSPLKCFYSLSVETAYEKRIYCELFNKRNCKKPAILLSSRNTGVSRSRAEDSYQIHLLALLQHREITVFSKRLKILCQEMLL